MGATLAATEGNPMTDWQCPRCRWWAQILAIGHVVAITHRCTPPGRPAKQVAIVKVIDPPRDAA
jgi:hypothetical protein